MSLKYINYYMPSREKQALELVAEGMTDREIGVALNLSKHTVKNYLSRAFIRLGVKSRAHAVAVAIERGLIKNKGCRSEG